MIEDYNYLDLFYIKKSPIHGYGVFAKNNIEKKAIIDCPRYIMVPNFLIKNRKINNFLNKILSPKYQTDFSNKNNIIYYDSYVFKTKFYVEDKKMKEIYFIPITKLVFCNSSIDPNIEATYDPSNPTIYFESTKNINKDDEIFLEYLN